MARRPIDIARVRTATAALANAVRRYPELVSPCGHARAEILVEALQAGTRDWRGRSLPDGTGEAALKELRASIVGCARLFAECLGDVPEVLGGAIARLDEVAAVATCIDEDESDTIH
jgi:hypothetical protein